MQLRALVRTSVRAQHHGPTHHPQGGLPRRRTTGPIGKEKGLRFPGNLSGLAFWRVAAREQADVEPIRKALLELSLPSELHAYLETAGAEQLREDLLRRIRWLGSGPSPEEVERDLHDHLVYFGNELGVGAQDSKNALNALVVEVLNCARRPPEARYLTAADLVTVFQKNTYRLVPPNALQTFSPSLTSGAASVIETAVTARDVAAIPLPPRAAARTELVRGLHKVLVEAGALWMHGSSGLGKTTLALLLARSQNVAWTFADLRGLEARELRLALARLSSSLGSGSARGLILDDLPADLDNATMLAVKSVARAAVAVDAVLIVTCAKRPPPTLAGGLGLSREAVREVPYLTEDDVGEMVHRAGGDSRLWARVVYLFCGGGHPQLVDARIVGLSQRGWPPKEQLADLLPTAGTGELEDEKRSVRTRLLRELDDSNRELLLRLSLLMGNFDRALMSVVADVAPPVPHAVLRFEALVGPWIEQVGADRFRLSPLLGDSGAASLGEALRNSTKTAVLEDLIARRPFPADQLLQVFVLAFALKHAPALTWFARILAQASTRNAQEFKRLAEEVSVFALADRGPGVPLFAESPGVSTMLRFAQLRVAIATGGGASAARILDRMLAEIEMLPMDLRPNLTALALGTALPATTVPLAPKRWLGMLRSLSELPGLGRILGKKAAAQTDPLSGLTATATHAEMMFIVRASALAGIDELEELVAELDSGPASIRERYLNAASNIWQSVSHIVAPAWLASVRADGFDGRTAAETLGRLDLVAGRWTNKDMAIELACAQAVMLDEYAEDAEGALAVLASAQGRYPSDYRLSRQRQKIYYRGGQHALALQEFESFANAFPEGKPVDRAYAMREAGRSAAELGDLERARNFFEKAWESARRCGDGMRPMTAGLAKSGVDPEG